MDRIVFRKSFAASLLFLALFVLTINCLADEKGQHVPATQQRFSDVEKWVKAFEDLEYGLE